MTGSTKKIITCLNCQEVPQFICTTLTSRHSVLNVHISSSHFLKKVKTCPLNFKVNKRLDVSVSGLSNRQDSYGRKQWHPTPVLLPGKSHGRRSLKSWTWLSDFTFTFMHWRRKWQPTPGFLPGESQGRRSLVGCRLCGHTESDTTEAT